MAGPLFRTLRPSRRVQGLIECGGARGIVTDEKQARRYLVSGMVQGVGFRFFAQRVADRIGVSGYATNLRGGQVEVYAIGTEEQLKALKKELERGPGAANIEGVAEEEAEMDAKYTGGFTIEREGW